MRGLGNDIIEVERIRNTIKRYGTHFYHKIFTKKELEYCLKYQDPVSSLAARFSAKEAIAKALGTGFGHAISWLDIEILNDENGRPYVTFSDSLNQAFSHPQVLISMSHSKTYATAVAIWIE